MSLISFFTIAYSHLRNYKGIPNGAMSIVRGSMRMLANKALPYCLSTTVANRKQIETEVIVSFTSFPTRINSVWQVVECMKRQTYKPYKILLWLSREQFPMEENIPLSLRERQDDVFEIRLVDGDIRSHKKYYYVAREFPNSLVFLIDDDIYYRPDIIENSVKVRNQTTQVVVCNYASRITYDDNGKHKKYIQWEEIIKSTASKDIFFGTGGGTLFCPSEMYKDLTAIGTALELTPTADDVWVNAMSRLAGLKVMVANGGLFLPIVGKNDVALSSVNNGENQNDVQIEAIEKRYGRIFDKS